MSEALEIEKDKTYVIEIDHIVSEEHVRSVIKTFKESTGSNAIVLHGARLARVASEAEEAIERVRKIHTPFWLDEPHCSECHSYEVDENYAIYPCPTIRALDGETDEA